MAGPEQTCARHQEGPRLIPWVYALVLTVVACLDLMCDAQSNERSERTHGEVCSLVPQVVRIGFV